MLKWTYVCRYGGNLGRSASTFHNMFPKNSSRIPQACLAPRLLALKINNWSGQTSWASPCPQMTPLCHCRITEEKLVLCYAWLIGIHLYDIILQEFFKHSSYFVAILLPAIQTFRRDESKTRSIPHCQFLFRTAKHPLQMSFWFPAYSVI